MEVYTVCRTARPLLEFGELIRSSGQEICFLLKQDHWFADDRSGRVRFDCGDGKVSKDQQCQDFSSLGNYKKKSWGLMGFH